MVFPKSVSAKGSSTSSCVHIFITSSYLLIFLSSDLQIFSSSHLLIFLSSGLHIFSSSHLLSLSLPFSLCLLPSVTVPLLLFLVSLKSAGSANQAKRSGHPFAVRVAQHAFFFRLFLVRRQPFGTKRGSSVKNCSKIAILKCWRPLSHETRFECQKLR